MGYSNITVVGESIDSRVVSMVKDNECNWTFSIIIHSPYHARYKTILCNLACTILHACLR